MDLLNIARLIAINHRVQIVVVSCSCRFITINLLLLGLVMLLLLIVSLIVVLKSLALRKVSLASAHDFTTH